MLLFAVVLIATVALSPAQEQPSPQCMAAYNATFYSANTSCAEAYNALFSNTSTDQQMMMVCSAGQQCNSMIENIISLCGDTIFDPNRGFQDLVCTTGPSGANCFNTIFLRSGETSIFGNTTFSDVCSEVIFNQCPDSCKQSLNIINMEFGCCWNTLFSEDGRSNDIADQIQHAVITRDIYRVCGISSAGFCAGINPAPYSSAADRCTSARNSFISDSTCLDYYLALGRLSSATAVNNAATAICASQRCKNRMSSYIDFLITCRVGNFLSDDDDDDDDGDDDEEDTSYLELAYLTGNTTCRVDSTNTSCLSSIYFNQQYALVSAAFDSDNESAVCISAVTGPTCSAQCTQVIMEANQSVGCCFGEFSRALLGDDILTSVLNRCGVTSLGQRCTEPEAIQDASVEGGANTQRGFGIIFILLLGVITIMFS